MNSERMITFLFLTKNEFFGKSEIQEEKKKSNKFNGQYVFDLSYPEKIRKNANMKEEIDASESYLFN